MALAINIEPFKEPKGFLKLLQWLFAICAFATTVNFTTTFEFIANVKCAPGAGPTEVAKVTVAQAVEYPFDLDQPYHSKRLTMGDYPECANVTGAHATNFEINFVSNVKTDAEFFVTTGVLCFLYATALIGIYAFADKLYNDNPNAPVIDFVFTVIFAVFWLSGSAAWAKGLSDLRAGANPDVWSKDPRLFYPEGLVQLPIQSLKAGAFGGITISILFGFINFILWAANLWFLYKETTWFESIIKNTQPSASTTAGA